MVSIDLNGNHIYMWIGIMLAHLTDTRAVQINKPGV